VKSYNRLASNFELIVIEGAGGASEINLRDRDVVNWRVAELADAPVLIVADIDKGGALAALVGTVSLLSPSERDRVKGLVINKFRGDLGLLAGGLRIIQARTGVRILGVLPYAADLDIPAEDSASLNMRNAVRGARPVKVGVVRLPCIANYTDFEALAREPDVHVQYVESSQYTAEFDLLCLPGSKSTIADLDWIRGSGWARRIHQHHSCGGSILGVCAGYQMLGRVIADPAHVESSVSETAGLGLLEVETVFGNEKVTALVRAAACSSEHALSGYEIHCGRIHRKSAAAAFRIRERNGRPADEFEGALSDDGRVLGTSIHGLFDDPKFRRHYLDGIRQRNGLEPLCTAAESAETLRLRAYDRFADLLSANLDISSIATLAGLNPAQISRHG
jgi:adenosylcobyric acid synthase